MPRSEWTSSTLPKLPNEPSVKLAEARWETLQLLVKAESAEREAQVYRSAANAAAQHFHDLLEATVSDPLFEVEP